MATTRRRHWSALLRLALGAAALQLYCAPLRLLEHDDIRQRQQRDDDHVASGSGALRVEQFQDQLFMRMWLTFALTLYTLCGVISKQVVLVSLLHALIHFARSISTAPPIIAKPSAPLLNVAYYWRTNSVESCAYEYGALLSFALLLRYVLFPPVSALATFQRHSRNLKAFFAHHDREFVPLVDRLLEEYTGHERLLYARIRRLYCTSTTESSSDGTTTFGTAAAATHDKAPAPVQLMTP